MAITEYEDQIKAIVDNPNHTEFIYEFLNVYDIPKATVTKLRKGINNLAKEENAVYLKNKVYFKVSNGHLLQDYTNLQEKVNEIGSKPRYLIITDYHQLLAKDTKTNETLDIEFVKLPQYFDFFLAWNGIEKADFDKENPADVRAAERFAKLYDVVKNDNPEATPKGLNLFLIRILFCLFAEDTNIFEHDLFTNRVKQMTAGDGGNFDQFIGSLFGVLDFEKGQRPVDTPSWLNDFPYVDGDLFKDRHESLHFSAKSRKLIIDAGELLKWDQINPDILGSMIQAVASEDSRSHLGMHYTSVPNIMKVIKPLFLDKLREDFEAAKGNENRLQQLYDRIGKIKFMDPACGSGNFLIITYKELRQLEIDILIELNNIGVYTMYVPSVTLDQFYGIEIDDFACDVTRLSLWIAEHQMNVKLHEQISDAVRPTLPLQHAGAIICANALRIDWSVVLKNDGSTEIYLFGNPPYLGAKLQSTNQKKDLKEVFSGSDAFKKLDYISGWFLLAAKYIHDSLAKSAFISTNSICQGEQVSHLWPTLFKYIDIKFAYQSFKWKNNAKSNAGVTVSIIGFENKGISSEKSLYHSDYVEHVDNISPYLSSGDNVIVTPSKKVYSKLPKMVFGSMPRDDGNLILNEVERKRLIDDGVSSNIIRKFIGSKELIDGKNRYCLWMNESDYDDNRTSALLTQRVDNVAEYRKLSKAKSTRDAARYPWSFVQRGEYDKATSSVDQNISIIIPRHSSQNRLYIPMGVVDSRTIIADSAMAIYNAPLYLLGILESKMHMVWLDQVGGKLETRYRYSSALVYNTFPIPALSKRRQNEIESLVLALLDVREEEAGSLSDLYGSPLAEINPIPMNSKILDIHKQIDLVIDRAYKNDGFRNDEQRLEMLLNMYRKQVENNDR